jgi:uncharacterized RDD family membrane protein YckC
MSESINIASVTGIDVRMRIAGPGARSYAFIIDWHIRLVVALAWILVGVFVHGMASFDLQELPSSWTFTVALPALAIYTFYHPVLEVLMGGRTPGKRMAGVRIVTLEGHVPGIGALIVRNLLRFVDSLPMFYALGLLCTMVTAQSVRIGDLAAGTILIYDRQVDDPVKGLSEASLNRIGLQQNELVMDLVSRWDELKPEVRRDLGKKLLSRLGVDVSTVKSDEVLFARLNLLLK